MSKKLADITNKEWNSLAQDYVKTNAILITRMYFFGFDLKTNKKTHLIDDWLYTANKVMLAECIDVKEVSDSIVNSIVVKYCGIHRQDNVVMPDEYCTLSWNPETFSWNVYAKEVSNIEKAFTVRNLDFNLPHSCYLDVPIGHVCGITNADIGDIIDNKLNRFYSTDFQQLGYYGEKYSKSYRINL